MRVLVLFFTWQHGSDCARIGGRLSTLQFAMVDIEANITANDAALIAPLHPEDLETIDPFGAHGCKYMLFMHALYSFPVCCVWRLQLSFLRWELRSCVGGCTSQQD